MTTRETRAHLYRVEELLLELVYDRFKAEYNKATSDDDGWPTETEDPVGHGRHLGWNSAWDEALESLRQIIADHEELNDYKLEQSR